VPFSPFPGRDSDVEIVNSYADGDINLTARRGTLASGKQRKARYAIDIKSEPLLFDLNEMNLGGRLAEVWAQRIRDNIQGIAVRASDATIAMRTKAAAAFASGQAWATKRYAGGRIGPMAPNQSDKLFNDSGRLAAGVFVRQNLTDATYTVNLPANRFNREAFGRGYDAMVAKFVELVPMLDPKKAAGDPAIEKAVKESVADMVVKLEADTAAALLKGRAKLKAARMRVAKQLVGIARGALGL
jgi:hypothetical protein